MSIFEWKSGQKAGLTVFTIGLLVALLWTFVIFPRFSPIKQVFDLNGFGEIAEHIWRGEGFSQGDGPTLRRAPLYPTLIAGVFHVFGFDPEKRQRSYIPVQVLQCLFAGFTCLGAFCIANRLFGLRVAVIAGLLCAIWPQCLRYIGAIDVEATMTLMITLMTLTALRCVQEPTIRHGAVCGIVIGLAILTKPLPLLFPVLLLGLLLLRQRRSKQRFPLGAATACVGATILVCLPWVIRNHIVTQGRFHGISSNAAGEFIRGYVNARPKFFLLRTRFQGNWDWEANLYEEALLAPQGFSFFSEENGKKRPMIQNVENALRKDAIEGKIAKEMVLRDPIGFVRKFIIQFFTFWYIVETPGKSLLVGFFALVAWVLAFVGWRGARRAGIDVAPVLATVLYFNVLYAATLALARYSMPVYPSLLAISANGLMLLAAAFARRPTLQAQARMPEEPVR